MEANAHDPSFALTVSAPTNSDAHALGAAIREQRRQIGLVTAKVCDLAKAVSATGQQQPPQSGRGSGWPPPRPVGA